jgi:hypothetical protein
MWRDRSKRWLTTAAIFSIFCFRDLNEICRITVKFCSKSLE